MLRRDGGCQVQDTSGARFLIVAAETWRPSSERPCCAPFDCRWLITSLRYRVIGFALLRSRMIPSDACANLGCDATRGAQAKARLGTREEATVDSEDQRYDRAHARVQAVKGFYTHATAYVLVNNIGLFVINLLTGWGFTR